MDFADQDTALTGRQGHAQQHVSEHRVDRGVRQRQRVAYVVDEGHDAVGQAAGRRCLAQLAEAHCAEVRCLHGESAGGEEQRVAAVPAPSSRTSLACARAKRPAAWTAGSECPSPYMPGLAS